jgi:Carboxypeptidase regulatory-like domain
VPLGALLAVLALSTFVHAQAASATLGGPVLDESSAVVPDTRITVVNLDTGLRRETTTDAQGSFAVPLLPPGRYRVTAERDGFRPAEIAALDLNVGDNLGVRLVLKVPRVGESVAVPAEAARVSTSPAVSTVVDRTFVGNLPLNGRSFQSLITMTPGVVLTPASSTSPGQFSVNGQRSDANYSWSTA